jgi:Protein of unknown function (DUF2924)
MAAACQSWEVIAALDRGEKYRIQEAGAPVLVVSRLGADASHHGFVCCAKKPAFSDGFWLAGVPGFEPGNGGIKIRKRPLICKGFVLMREHRGVRHTVTVVPNGFVWQEQTYPSLSTIARAITGTSWNGPRFFGLRIKRDADQVEAGQ